jgi:hypothetical protein
MYSHNVFASSTIGLLVPKLYIEDA